MIRGAGQLGGLLLAWALLLAVHRPSQAAEPAGSPTDAFATDVQQVTFGPRHHFFGYIGHVRTIPWNASGRYVLALRSEFQDRMPRPDDAAEIVLLDTTNGYRERVIDRTRGWNFQQGTMFYWNPASPETQFFFNDRDPSTQEVFCVLFDLARGNGGERIAEYRFPGVAIGNGGVAQRGGWFAAINYGRLSRLRPVTGYPQAFDATAESVHPSDDGVFKVNVASKERQLLVSYKQLAEILRPQYPAIDRKALFINHTMWSRSDERIFFFVRADFESSDRAERIDVPFTMAADGTDVRPLGKHIGGHLEWQTDRRMIGSLDKRQVVFDIDRREVVETIGSPESIPSPGDDIALSPDGTWLANGFSRSGDRPQNFYTLFRLADGAWTRTTGFDRGIYNKGVLRIDPAPGWNRDGTRLLVGGLAGDGTRQLFVITLQPRSPR